ncbi:PQQ-binding-like beta-propeller repeat protein [Neomoorella carbonis]|uniref:outer membrane protein assembly factor BamB family protein n=1 Tax=Neomoorella carbonis TaxID=3062783 RepID=UPI003872DBEE
MIIWRRFMYSSTALLVALSLCLSPLRPAGAGSPYTILWQRQIAGGTGNSGLPPVISPWGDIFLVTSSSILRLNDRGEQIWDFKTGERPTGAPVFFPDGSAFVPTTRTLYEIKPYGRPGWSFSVASGESGGNTSSPTLARGPGESFYLLLGKSLYAVAPRRDMLWYMGQSDYPVAVDADRQYVFVARTEKDSGTTVEALDGSGATVWRRGFAEQKQLYLSLSPGGKYLYVAGVPKTASVMNKCALYALDAASGAIVWARRFSQAEIGNINAAPDGLVYLVAGKERLYALDGATGEERLSTRLLDLSGAAPAVDRQGTIYVPGRERLYAVDGRDGRLLWDMEVDGGVQVTPALGPDGLTVYFTGGKGILYALQTAYANTSPRTAGGAVGAVSTSGNLARAAQ